MLNKTVKELYCPSNDLFTKFIDYNGLFYSIVVEYLGLLKK